MLRIFSVGIQLTPEGKVEAAQFPPSAAHPALIFADVVDGEIVAYSTTYSSPAYLLKFENSYHAPAELSTQIERARKDVASRFVSPQDFVQRYGLPSLKAAIEQSQILDGSSESNCELGCMPLDVLVNGTDALKAHAALYTSPKRFLEDLIHAMAFDPGINQLLASDAAKLAEVLYQGQSADECPACWNVYGLKPGIRALLVEAFVQTLNRGFSKVLHNLLVPHKQHTQDFILEVLRHPDARSIELAELPVHLLAKIRELGLTFRTTPMFAQKALAAASFKHHYIRLGYDWRSLPELEDQLGADRTEDLVNYLKSRLREIAQHSIESGAFWDPQSSWACRDAAPIIQAISEADPEGFAEVFERLDYAHKLACVSAGFVNKSWIDLERMPQAGLVKVLEADLGF